MRGINASGNSQNTKPPTIDLSESQIQIQLAASGDGSQLAASGDRSQLAASGYGSVVANIGIGGRAKAARGSWITLAEWAEIDSKMTPIHVQTRKVDGKHVKANTWYKLEGGKFVIVE